MNIDINKHNFIVSYGWLQSLLNPEFAFKRMIENNLNATQYFEEIAEHVDKMANAYLGEETVKEIKKVSIKELDHE